MTRVSHGKLGKTASSEASPEFPMGILESGAAATGQGLPGRQGLVLRQFPWYLQCRMRSSLIALTKSATFLRL